MNHSKHIASLVLVSSLFISQAFAADVAPTPPSSPPSAATMSPPPPPSPTSSSSGSTTKAPANWASYLNVPGAPKLISQTATSVTLEWIKVGEAKSYIVKYSKSSVAEAFKAGKTNAAYDMESDQITATGTTIKDLKINTTYYFAVVALDAANNESATNSEELAVTLSGGTSTTASGATASTASDFKLTGVTVMDATTLTLDFSATLGLEPVTLKLVKSSNASALTIQSVTSGKMPNQVIVKLATALDPASSYSLIVMSAKDTKGNPISQGLNAVKEFATSVNLVKTASVTLVGSGTTLSGALTNIEASGGLNAAPELPATGTQETLLLVLAAIISFAIVLFVRSRRAL